MKHLKKSFALVLVLCILLGLMPAGVSAAEASAYAGEPTADVLQVVIDYGKTVDIALSEVKAGIHTNRNGSVGSLVGFMENGSSGELLSAAPTITCNTTGKSLTTALGRVLWKDDSTLSYTPDGIMTDVDYIFAVYALSSSTHAYIKVEIQIIPADIMYYEAEELTDFGLDTYDTSSGQQGTGSWGTVSQGDSANDIQTYDNADLVSSMVIDRKQIPASSFFVDFDGTGNTNRYSKDPGYGKCNFDNAGYWIHGTTSASDGVQTTPGYYTLNLTSGKTQHYFQTTTSGGTEESEPLYYRPSNDHVFQIRFRMTGCADATAPEIKLYLKRNGSEANVNTSSTRTISLTAEQIKQLNNEEYVTVTDNLSNWGLYRDGSRVLSFRYEVNGVTAESGGKLIVDYIYMGGPSGLRLPTIATETKNYLFFGFDHSYKDSRYYYSAYNDTDFSSASNWTIGDDSKNKSISNSSPGYIKITDAVKWASNGYHYNYIHTGSTSKFASLNYKPNTNDVFEIRFKVSGGRQLTENTAAANNYGKCCVRFEGRGRNTSNTSGAAILYGQKNFTLSDAKADYITVRFTPNDSYFDLSKLGSIRPTFFNVDEGTFYIDYVYLGPSDIRSSIISKSQTADKYLFVDFNNSDNDKFRYANPTYGYQNLDLIENLKKNTNTTLSQWTSVPNGVVMTDATPSGKNSSGTEDDANTSRLYFWMNNLALTPAANHYVQMRMKIEAISGSVSYYDKDDASETKPWIDFYFVNSAKSTYLDKKYRRYIDLDNELGRWITVTIPMTHSDYTKATITRIVPAVRGTQNAKVTLDYVYLGPPIWDSPSDTFAPTVAGNPANKALYFGFDNSNSARYGVSASSYAFNDTYNSSNYDTGTWTVSGTGSGISYNSTKGIASITIGTSDYGGPILTSGTLKYHPYNADVLQTRFRLNGCKVDPNGNPRLEAKITGYLGTTSTTHTITRLFADTNNFQSITIPMKSELQKFTTVTKIVLQFYDIQGGTLEIDHIYLGDGTASGVPTYGYDSAYTNDSMLSDGRSLYVVGHGSRQDPKVADLESGKYVYPEKYTEASFSFTGTGFDIISRTGAEQGTIRVGIYTDPHTTEESRVRTVTMNCLGDLELYQIPVVSVQGLAHGTYYVRINVSAGVTFPGIGTLIGKEFHLDAIRIYDPIDVSKTTLTKNQRAALDAYRRDKEAYSYIKEIRDTLLSVADFTAALLGNGTNGALFVDSTIEVTCPEATDETIEVTDATEPTSESAEVITDHRVVTAADYKDMGPKNEVYLSPGQAIAFKLEKDSTETPVSVDIGAKTVQGGESAVLSAGFVATVGSNALTTVSSTKWNVNSASAQYFALDESKLSAGTDIYLVIYNAHTGTDKTKNILSITDLKVCYAQKPARTDLPQDGTSAVEVPVVGAKRTKEAEAEPFHFAVDGRTMEAAEVYLNAKGETPVEESTEPVGDIHIYHSLNLASDISVNYLIPVQELQDFDTFKMELRIPVYEGDTLVGYRTESPEPVEKDGFWYFTVNGLAAIHMNDVMEATLCMTKGETTTFSSTDFYSIAQYAYGQLSKEGVSDRLKTLCADLLVYGAKAQLFKGYRTDAPADMTMTEEERVYCTDLTAVTFGNNNQVLADLPDPVVLWKGKSLVLDSRVCLQYIVDLSAYEGSVEELRLRLTYRDHQGQTQTAILTDPAVYNGDLGWYSFTFDGLLAAELRSVVDGAVFCGDTQVSQTLRYSADTYGNHKTGLLADLCKALFAYADSAKAFFHN